jgi:hypothetical protein
VRGVKLLLPLECRAKEVSVFISSEEVHVFDIKTDEKIAVYTLKTGISKTHIVRQKSLRTRKYSEMKVQLQARFRFQEWNQFVDGNYQRYKRYFFDQFNDFQKKFPHPCEEVLLEAVRYCLINKTFSMSQLYDTYKYLLQGNKFEPEPLPTEYNLVNNKHYQPVKVAKRQIESYKHLMHSNPMPEVTL